MTIFQYASLFASVYFITQVSWVDLSSIESFRNVGTLGGLLYFEEVFRKESRKDDAKRGDQE